MLWFCFKNPDGKVHPESYVDLENICQWITEEVV